jgi:small subunit ribosomal protein S16
MPVSITPSHAQSVERTGHLYFARADICTLPDTVRRRLPSRADPPYNQKLSIAFSRQRDSFHGRHQISPGRRQEASVLQHVVADSRNRRDGRFIERVGFYNPIAAQGEEALRLSVDRISFWQQRGARLSDTVAGLVKRSSKSAATAAGRPAAPRPPPPGAPAA